VLPLLLSSYSLSFQAIRLGANVLGCSKICLRLALLDHVASGAALDLYGVVSRDAKDLLEKQPEINLLAPTLRLYLQKNHLRLKARGGSFLNKL
jgi:hypothetical protein